MILAEFKRDILPLTEFKPENNWDLLALAHHHGPPNRLLDWTCHALVGMWFAVERPAQKNDKNELENGVVWILAATVIDPLLKKILPNAFEFLNKCFCKICHAFIFTSLSPERSIFVTSLKLLVGAQTKQSDNAI